MRTYRCALSPAPTPAIQQVYENRRQMMESGEGIDWAMAEALAFGTLLSEGEWAQGIWALFQRQLTVGRQVRWGHTLSVVAIHCPVLIPMPNIRSPMLTPPPHRCCAQATTCG